MALSNDFRTRTIYEKRKHYQEPEKWVVGEDIGYSSVKGFCANSYYCFPSYATKMASERVEFKPDKTEIILRDHESGEQWLVGAVAQNNMSVEDTKDSEESMYGRNRYFDPMFRVYASVGIGLGLSGNEFGIPPHVGDDLDMDKIVLQTGLPPKYIKSDAELLREALGTHYNFSIKFGDSGFIDYKFDLDPERIRIMSQPKGTFRAICVDREGHFVPAAEDYARKKVLVVDGGFRTLDIFPIFAGEPKESQTFDNLGMCEVLKDTSEAIYKKYGVNLSIPVMQRFLEEGRIRKLNRRAMETTTYEFDDLLIKANKEIFGLALDKIKQLYNYLYEIDYIVLTGGTGDAWYNYFKEGLKNMITAGPGMEPTLRIVPGNINDPDIPMFLANVEGYYMSAVSRKNK